MKKPTMEWLLHRIDVLVRERDEARAEAKEAGEHEDLAEELARVREQLATRDRLLSGQVDKTAHLMRERDEARARVAELEVAIATLHPTASKRHRIHPHNGLCLDCDGPDRGDCPGREPRRLCERDPECVWPEGHRGDTHCRTVGGSLPRAIVTTGDVSDWLPSEPHRIAGAIDTLEWGGDDRAKDALKILKGYACEQSRPARDEGFVIQKDCTCDWRPCRGAAALGKGWRCVREPSKPSPTSPAQRPTPSNVGATGAAAGGEGQMAELLEVLRGIVLHEEAYDRGDAHVATLARAAIAKASP